MIDIGPITILTKREGSHIAANIMAQQIQIQWLGEVVQGYIRILDTATDALVALPCECVSVGGELDVCQRCRGMQDVQAVLSEHFEVVVDGAA